MGKVARMKKRNRQNHTESHGESMSDVVEKVMIGKRPS